MKYVKHKFISFVLVQIFLLSSFTCSESYNILLSRSDAKVSCLSAPLNLDIASFQGTFEKACLENVLFDKGIADFDKEKEQSQIKLFLKKVKIILTSKGKYYLKEMVGSIPKGWPSRIGYWGLIVSRRIVKRRRNRINFLRVLLNFYDRLFIYKKLQKELKGQKLIWVNVTGEGELNLVGPLMRRIRQTYPDYKLIIACPYPELLAYAEENFPDALAVYTRYSLPFFAKDFFKSVKVKLFLMVEGPSRVVPGTLKIIKQSGGKIVLINGVNTGILDIITYRGYEKELFDNIDLLLLKSDESKQQLLEFYPIEDKMRILGDLKFDSSMEDVPFIEKQRLMNLLGLEQDRPVMVVGSAHNYEFEPIYRIFNELKKDYPDLFLLIAPRERIDFDDAMALVPKGLKKARKTILEKSTQRVKDLDVVVLDTIGELKKFYSLATFVVVGGSFGKGEGGHNPLEPISFAKPTIVGPDMVDFVDIIGPLLNEGGILQVQNEQMLKEQIRQLLEDQSKSNSVRKKGKDFLNKNLGATSKTMEEIIQLLPLEKQSPQHNSFSIEISI